MKRRWARTESPESTTTLSPSVLSRSHSEFLKMAAQQHLADLRTANEAAQTLASISNATDRNRPASLPNKCIMLGPEPGSSPVRRVTDWESNNSHNNQDQHHQQQDQKDQHDVEQQKQNQHSEERQINGQSKRRRTVNKNNKKEKRRRKRPRIPPPESHPERDLFYLVNFTSCQIGSQLLCPPSPTHPSILTSPQAGLTDKDSLLLQNYREMQRRFHAGFDLSTLATLHQQLQAHYGKAIQVLAQSTASNTDTSTSPNNESRQPIDGSNDEALTLRNELAGLWILYAHIVLEIGLRLCQHQQQDKLQRPNCQNQGTNHPSSRQHPQQQQEQSPQDNEPSEQDQQQQQQPQGSNPVGSSQSPARQTDPALTEATDDAATAATLPHFTVHDVLTYVSAVLQAAGRCPLVGNHKYIALSLGRFMVVETVLGASATESVPLVGISPTRMKAQLLKNSVTHAIAVCRQTLDLCHGETLNSTYQQHKGPNVHDHQAVVDSIQKFCHCLSKRPFIPNNGSDKAWLTTISIKQDMLAILALPDQLIRKANISTPLMNDYQTARILCHEINRWCRLREKLEKRVVTVITPCLDYRSNSLQSVMATQLMDQFLCYRTMDCPFDIRVPGAKWYDLEYHPPGENGGLVQWNW